MDTPLKIVLVSGSTRRESANTALLATVGRLITERAGAVDIRRLAVGELPHYERELELSGASEPVLAAHEMVASADALVISTPAYNGEMPGALKNALDWLSRPQGGAGQDALRGRLTAVLSASPGARGAAGAQVTLKAVLGRCGARVVEHPQVAVGDAPALRGADGLVADPDVVAALAGLTDALLAAVGPRESVPV
ncbi:MULTISPECIES: NADPH-dependent FMN reductase [unclassified Streptomyces]|uniref:NADPH-dependent FMN reductase n=1 Tax=unclassified Streptomyces TaxID=2593676 RepID=UPI00324F31D6